MATQAAIKRRWNSKAQALVADIIEAEQFNRAVEVATMALQLAYELGLGAGIDSIEQRKQERDSSHG